MDKDEIEKIIKMFVEKYQYSGNGGLGGTFKMNDELWEWRIIKK